MKINEPEAYFCLSVHLYKKKKGRKCKWPGFGVCASNDLFRMSALKWLKKMAAAWGFIYFSSKPHCS